MWNAPCIKCGNPAVFGSIACEDCCEDPLVIKIARIASWVHKGNFELGLNTVIGYEGIENFDDILHYIGRHVELAMPMQTREGTPYKRRGKFQSWEEHQKIHDAMLKEKEAKRLWQEREEAQKPFRAVAPTEEV